MPETVPTPKARKAPAKHLSRGCALAVCSLMFLVVSAAMFFAGQPSWLFFLGVGLATYFSASVPPSRAERRRQRAQLPPAYETAPPPSPARRHTARRRIQVPVNQFDEQGHTPLERALHFDDAEK